MSDSPLNIILSLPIYIGASIVSVVIGGLLVGLTLIPKGQELLATANVKVKNAPPQAIVKFAEAAANFGTGFNILAQGNSGGGGSGIPSALPIPDIGGLSGKLPIDMNDIPGGGIQMGNLSKMNDMAAAATSSKLPIGADFPASSGGQIGNVTDQFTSLGDNNKGITSTISNLTPENASRKAKADISNQIYNSNAAKLVGKNSPIITGNKVFTPFNPSNINKFQTIQSNDDGIQNTTQSAFKVGGRKTKNNRKTRSEPKIRKPRTKKCLVTKGNQMYMSFCV